MICKDSVLLWQHNMVPLCMLLPALDLQSCGVTTDGAKLFIEVLKLNSCLMILDIRANALIGKASVVLCRVFNSHNN